MAATIAGKIGVKTHTRAAVRSRAITIPKGFSEAVTQAILDELQSRGVSEDFFKEPAAERETSDLRPRFTINITVKKPDKAPRTWVTDEAMPYTLHFTWDRYKGKGPDDIYGTYANGKSAHEDAEIIREFLDGTLEGSTQNSMGIKPTYDPDQSTLHFEKSFKNLRSMADALKNNDLIRKEHMQQVKTALAQTKGRR